METDLIWVNKISRQNVQEKFAYRLQNDIFADKLLNALGSFSWEIDFEDMCNYLHNADFWDTHLKDGNKYKHLILHYLWQNEEKVKNLFGRFAKEILDKVYASNILPMSQDEEELILQSILDVDQWKSTLIISNHDTFANLPMIIYKYLQVAHKNKIKMLNKNIRTILWPLLMTHVWQKFMITVLSNVIITVPAGKNSKDLKPFYSEHRKCAEQLIFDKLKYNDDRWNIILLAPSWTRDIVLRDELGKPIILIPDESWISNRATFSWIINPAQKLDRVNIYIIWANTTAMKKGIPIQNHQRNRGVDVELHIKDVSSSREEKKLNTTKDMIDILQETILYNWGAVSYKVSGEVFEQLKALHKNWSLNVSMLAEYGVNL